MSDVTDPARAGTLAAFRYRNFRIMWTASLLSSSGSWLQMIAVPYVIYSITGSGAWLGFAGFLGYAPMVITGPYAGSVADRFDRRRVLIYGGLVQTFVTLLLWLVWVAGDRHIGVFLALLTAGSFVGGFTVAAWQSFVTELVPREHLLNAVTLNSTQFNAARAVGPAFGGVVLATLGVSWCFFFNAVSFLLMVFGLLIVRVPARVRPSSTDRPRPLREMREALGYVRTVPGIVTCLIVVTILGLIAGPVFNLIVVFADGYGVGGGAYGMLAACLGIGAVAVSPFVAGRGSDIRRSTLLSIAMVLYGCALVGLGSSPNVAMASVCLLFAGAGYLGMTASLNTAVQLQVREDMRGRTMALYLMVLTAAVPIGAQVQGWCVDLVGVHWTVGVGGALFVTAWFVLAVGLRRLRTIDLEDHAFSAEDRLHIAEAESTEAAIDPI